MAVLCWHHDHMLAMGMMYDMPCGCTSVERRYRILRSTRLCNKESAVYTLPSCCGPERETEKIGGERDGGAWHVG
jgi:hypothetical protein